MQDRPTVDELLQAIEVFLDREVVPNLAGSRGFHARVAANALRIVRRELTMSEERMDSEWEGLEQLLGPLERPATQKALSEAIRARNEELCERIREAGADGGELSEQVFEHVRRTVAGKLRVSDPGLLERDGAG